MSGCDWLVGRKLGDRCGCGHVVAMHSEREGCAVCQLPLLVEPGKTYVISVPYPLSAEETEVFRQRFAEATGATCIILVNGIRIAREEPWLTPGCVV